MTEDAGDEEVDIVRWFDEVIGIKIWPEQREHFQAFVDDCRDRMVEIYGGRK